MRYIHISHLKIAFVNIMYYLALGIILFIIFIALLIFAPKSKNFYTVNEQIEQIIPHIIRNTREEIASLPEDGWSQHYEFNTFKIAPLYMFGDRHEANISHMKKLVECLNFEYENLCICNIPPKTITDKTQEHEIISKTHLRCIVPIIAPRGVGRAGIWVNGEIKEFKKSIIVFDCSKYHLFYNSSKKIALYVSFDILRPYSAKHGIPVNKSIEKINLFKAVQIIE